MTRHYIETCVNARHVIILKHLLLHDTKLYRNTCYCSTRHYTEPSYCVHKIIENHVLLHYTTSYSTICYCTTRHYSVTCVIARHNIIQEHVLLHDTTIYRTMCNYTTRHFIEQCFITRHDIIQNYVLLHDTTLYINISYCTTRYYTEPCVTARKVFIQNNLFFTKPHYTEKRVNSQPYNMEKNYTEQCVITRYNIKQNIVLLHDTSLYKTKCYCITRHNTELCIIARNENKVL